MPKEREGTKSERESTKDARDERLATRASALPSTTMPLLSPFGLIRRFIEDLDRIGGITESAWNPALEVFERDGKFVVRTDVPGLDKDQINVEVIDDQLIISGERKREAEDRRENYYRSERSYGSFYRVVDLPEEVDPDDVVATFNNGVLEITVPAPTHSQPKRIEIREGTGAGTETSAQQQQDPSADRAGGPALH